MKKGGRGGSRPKPTGNQSKGSRFQKNGKPGKKGKDAKLEWNSVPIGEELLAKKDFENLVSFEELVDYNVVTNEDGTKEIQYGKSGGHDKAGKKRKADEIDEEEIETESETKQEKKKTQKKTKKSKSSNGTTAAAQDVHQVVNTSAGVVMIEDDDEEIPQLVEATEVPNPKKKAKNKKKKPKRKKVLTEDLEEEEEKEDDENVEEEDVHADEDVEEEDNEAFDKTEWVKLGVPELVIKALREKGFKKPTSIQALSLPAAILGKKDIVGAAETGSGKTLAFGIPIIDGILKFRNKSEENIDPEENRLKALILTPTRELAVQIKNHIDAAAKYANIKTVVIVGGLATQRQERLLKGRPDIVIATPGRLWELVQEGDEYLSNLSEIKYLAIDETDRMVERGHFQELEGILTNVNSDEATKEDRQNFIFSATLSFTHEPPKRLKMTGNKKMKSQQPKKMTSKEKLKLIMEMVGVRTNPKIVDITTSKGTCETLTEMQITCSLDQKDYYLYYFLNQNPGRTIVFSNSINCVRRLTNLFFLLEIGEVLPLHSEMQQKQRLRNLERFTANDKGILIATDVAARGLDIQNIQHVIHYQVPKTAESYIHRSGRTARAFKGGLAILMVEPSEITTMKNIFRSLGRDEMLSSFNVDGKIFRELKGTVEMAIKVEQFEHTVRKKLADHNWMDKAKKEMDLASSSDESDDGIGGITTQKQSLQQAKKKLDNYKKQLSRMLTKKL